MLWALLLACGSLAAQQSMTNAVAYNDFLVNEQMNIQNRQLEYIQYAVHSDDYNQVEGKRQAVKAQMEASLSRVKALPPFNEDAKLSDEMVQLIEISLSVVNTEFNEANTLKRNSRESYEAMEKYLAALQEGEQKLAEANARFGEAQKAFAERHGLELVESEGSNNVVETINKLNRYHRSIYLKEFQVARLNADFVDALNNKDIEAMDQARKGIQQACEENLKYLRSLPDFNGNTSYRDAAIAEMSYFQQLAGDKYTQLIAISKKEQPTQEDVNDFNSIIMSLNEELPELSRQFQEASAELMQENVPRPIQYKRT